MHHASDVFTVIGLDTVIRYQSPAIEQVLGHPATATIGRSFLDLVEPDDHGIARQLFERSRMQPGTPAVGEVHLREAMLGSGSTTEVMAAARLARLR